MDSTAIVGACRKAVNEPVGVTEPVIVEILGRATLEEALVLGDEVLIGQTVLEKLDLLTDCASHRLVPNPAHPDQPVTKVKLRGGQGPAPSAILANCSTNASTDSSESNSPSGRETMLVTVAVNS